MIFLAKGLICYGTTVRDRINDVFYTRINMKKNRPGILLQLLCSQDILNQVKEILLKETTTLGIRYYPISVHRMERKFIKVETVWGPITVKLGISEGEDFQSSPEYNECKKIAELHSIPLKEVYMAVWKQI